MHHGRLVHAVRTSAGLKKLKNSLNGEPPIIILNITLELLSGLSSK